MKELLLILIFGALIFMTISVCGELTTLTRVIKEKQLIFSIETLELDVEAQKGSVIYLPGG